MVIVLGETKSISCRSNVLKLPIISFDIIIIERQPKIEALYFFLIGELTLGLKLI